MTKIGVIKELEFNHPENPIRKQKEPIKDITPKEVLNVKISLVADSSKAPKFIRDTHVQFSLETGYKLDFSHTPYHYEF